MTLTTRQRLTSMRSRSVQDSAWGTRSAGAILMEWQARRAQHEKAGSTRSRALPMVSTVIRLAPLALLVVTARAAVAEQAVVPVRRATASGLEARAPRGSGALPLVGP